MGFMNKSIWYNFSRLLSFRAFLNFLVGIRGGGKSYGAKKLVINDFLKNKRQFIWLRRYKNEIFGTKKEPGVIQTFLKDLRLNGEFKGVKMEIIGNELHINNEVAGYFLNLNTSSKYKSIPWDEVYYMVYDEFIVRKGLTNRYLPNELFLFNELLETVFRMRDGKVILIGNAIKFANPYFDYYKIPFFHGEFYNNRARGLCVQNYSNTDFLNVKKDSPIGKLQNGTEYGDYALANIYLDDSDAFIASKSANATFKFALQYNSNKYGVWLDFDKGIMYINKMIDPSNKTLYVLKSSDHDVNSYLVKFAKNTQLDILLYMFKVGAVRFDDVFIKNEMYEILDRYVN